MAEMPESLCDTSEWIVVSESKDVCLTPLGGTPVPVPYDIVGRGNLVDRLARKTRFCSNPVFHLGSEVTRVEGDEKGSAGGLLSNVHHGVCYPATFSSTVCVESQPLIRHDDLFEMNAPSYGAPGNTQGYAVWKATPNAKDDESPPWYESAYESAKSRLDEMNQEIKKSERRFGQSLKKLGELDLDGLQQSPGEFVKEFGTAVKDGLKKSVEDLKELPGRVKEDGLGVILDAGKEKAVGFGDAISNAVDSLEAGNVGKALGGVASDLIRVPIKRKGKLARDSKTAQGSAKKKADSAKEKAQASEAELKANRKASSKAGGRISKSKSKKKESPQSAAARKELETLREDRKGLAKEAKADSARSRQADGRYEAETRNNANYDIEDVSRTPSEVPVELPAEVPQEDDLIGLDDWATRDEDGYTDLYIRGPGIIGPPE
ncbi:MAG: PAAR-like domain-containing protein [Planctomycetota bacterium]